MSKYQYNIRFDFKYGHMLISHKTIFVSCGYLQYLSGLSLTCGYLGYLGARIVPIAR